MSPQGKTSSSTHTLVVIFSGTAYAVSSKSAFGTKSISFDQNGPVPDNYIQIPDMVSSHV